MLDEYLISQMDILNDLWQNLALITQFSADIMEVF